MQLRPVALAAAVLLLVACESSRPAAGTATGTATGEAAPPIALAGSGYEAAALVTLDPVEPQSWSDLHNVIHLSDDIIVGGEPLTDVALGRLAGMGVKTILSVDGKAPNAAGAAALGMRYVHVPIHYSGMTADEMSEIVKTFRELEAPFYVHCFHGKHRGPAGAAVGRLVLDGVSRERALAEMRQWCGTSQKYEGLFRDVATLPVPSRADSAAYDFDFPATHPFKGLRAAMIEMARANDNLVDLAKRDWASDPDHPDVDPLNEASKLNDYFRAAVADPEHASEPADFQGWMSQAVAESARLRDHLAAVQAGRSGAAAQAKESMNALGKLCSSCHTPYRN